MYQKKEKVFLQKMSPHLSQLNVAMAHRNYFSRNNLQILKLAAYTKIDDHYSKCKLATFQIGKDCQMFIFYLSTQNIKFYWFVMKIKKFMLPIWWYNRGLFPLGNKYFGVFVLNGLIVDHSSVREDLKVDCIVLSAEYWCPNGMFTISTNHCFNYLCYWMFEVWTWTK